MSRVLIRQEQPDDEGSVRVVNEAAFGRSDEADLVNRLRLEGSCVGFLRGRAGEAYRGPHPV